MPKEQKLVTTSTFVRLLYESPCLFGACVSVDSRLTTCLRVEIDGLRWPCWHALGTLSQSTSDSQADRRMRGLAVDGCGDRIWHHIGLVPLI